MLALTATRRIDDEKASCLQHHRLPQQLLDKQQSKIRPGENTAT